MSSSVCQLINILAYLSPAILFSLFPHTSSYTTSSSPSLLSSLHFPSPLHCFFLLSLQFIPLWRGPVMSAPSSDKRSLSLTLFYRARGSRKRRPGTLLCSTADRSLSGGQGIGGDLVWMFLWSFGGRWEEACWPGLRGSGGATSKERGPLETEWCGEA